MAAVELVADWSAAACGRVVMGWSGPPIRDDRTVRSRSDIEHEYERALLAGDRAMAFSLLGDLAEVVPEDERWRITEMRRDLLERWARSRRRDQRSVDKGDHREA